MFKYILRAAVGSTRPQIAQLAEGAAAVQTVAMAPRPSRGKGQKKVVYNVDNDSGGQSGEESDFQADENETESDSAISLADSDEEVVEVKSPAAQVAAKRKRSPRVSPATKPAASRQKAAHTGSADTAAADGELHQQQQHILFWCCQHC